MSQFRQEEVDFKQEVAVTTSTDEVAHLSSTQHTMAVAEVTIISIISGVIMAKIKNPLAATTITSITVTGDPETNTMKRASNTKPITDVNNNGNRQRPQYRWTQQSQHK